MIGVPETARQILDSLAEAPDRIRTSIRSVSRAKLASRSKDEPWSIYDIVAHLRACSDVWGKQIHLIIDQDEPVQRHVSPRSSMRKPAYTEPDIDTALDHYTGERKKLLTVLSKLDGSGWARRGTFTGTSERGRRQTVLSCVERLCNHEQAHLDQIDALPK